MTKIALIGYGAMGRELERLAPEAGCIVTAIHDETTPLTEDSVTDWDVAIDFSTPDAALANARTVCSLGRDMVIGTTGWYQDIHVLKALQDQAGNGVVWGSNFSVGVQMFFSLARAAAAIVHGIPAYDVMVHEWHHARKKDSPSGTAISTANILLDEIGRKTHLQTETSHVAIDPSALHVTSTRGGDVVGKHTITIDGPFDRVEIVHDAKNRSGFALGALQAARWIQGTTGLYDFTDIFTDVIKRHTP